MKILIISLDRALVSKGRSDTEERFLDYSKDLEFVYFLIPHSKTIFRRVARNFKILSVGGIKPLKLVNLIKFGVDLVRSNRIDLIITNDLVMGYIGWLIKLFSNRGKLSVNVFGLETNYLFWPIFWLADSIRCDSKEAANKLAEKWKLKNKVAYIPVIPSQKMISRFKAYGQKSTSKKNNLLSVSSLIPQKGIDILLKAFSIINNKMPSIELDIVGEGPLKNDLLSFSQKLGIDKKVNFLGQVEYHTLPSYYSSHKLLVVSSWYEGGPRVIMEAAFSRLPVVSTDVGSVRDMLKDGQSVSIVGTGDYQNIANEVIKLLENQSLLDRYSREAYRDIQNYCNWKRNRSQLLKYWASIIDK